MKNSHCNLWAKGDCFRGKNCFFKHDPAKKGTTQRQTAPTTEGGSGGTPGNPEPTAPKTPAEIAYMHEPGGVSQGATHITEVDDAPPFVTQRPSACVNLSASGGEVLRRQIPQDVVYDFDKNKHSLPVVKPPGPGYC